MNQQVMEQGPAPSIEDRAAAAFMGFMGDKQVEPEQPQNETEAAPDDGDTNAPTPEEFFDFELDGQKYQLPKPLEKAVLQEKDYTQKSQKVAEQRKTLDTLAEQHRIASMRGEFEREVASEVQQLQAFDAVLSQQRQIDWASMTTDEILKHKIQLDSWKEQRDAIKSQLEGKYREWSGKRDEAIKGLKTKAGEVAASRIPGWNDATQKAVREHALTEGYTETELEQAGLDPRHWVTLWKAKQFDELKAKATKTVSDVKTVKSTPSNPMPQAVKDKFAFNKQMQKASTNSERKSLVEQRVGSMFSKR
jgi:hypothetical protein